MGNGPSRGTPTRRWAVELGKRRFALARALWDARGDRQRARHLAEQAREGFVVGGASREHSQAVERWLASR